MSKIENLTIEFTLAAPEAAFEAQNELTKILEHADIKAQFHHSEDTIALTFETAVDKDAFYRTFSEHLPETMVERLFKTDYAYDHDELEAMGYADMGTLLPHPKPSQ